MAQHYDSFTRALDRQQQNQTSDPSNKISRNDASASQHQEAYEVQNAGNGPSVAAFRSPTSTGPSSAPYLLSNDNYNGQSISPHLMELSSVHQPFTVSRLPSTSENQTASATTTTTTKVLDKGKFRENSTNDDMSEDEEEDDKDGLADLVKKMKTSPASSRAASNGATGLEETPIAGSIMGPSNELRPDPEAYRKLSSKEKRQLRNKISARNFRTRRKEHISHLEHQVADRDTIIEGLRQQLALVKVQNKDLTEEVRVLKSKAISNADVNRIIEALQKGAASSTSSTTNDMGPPSTLLRTSSNSSLTDTFNSARPSTPASPRSNSPHPFLSRPNTRKDLPATGSANSSKSFWGGVGGSGNNFMSVHTVLVPHLVERKSLGLDTQLPATQDSMATLTHLVGEKLNIGNSLDDKKQTKSIDVKHQMVEADVNEAIVSLLGEEDVAPPCYSEAIAAPPLATSSTMSIPSNIDFQNERVHASVLAALHKAFSTSNPSTLMDNKSALARTTAPPQLDANKIRALLEGRATLVLYDETKGQLWKDESDNSQIVSTNQAMTVLAST